MDSNKIKLDTTKTKSMKSHNEEEFKRAASAQMNSSGRTTPDRSKLKADFSGKIKLNTE